MPHNICSIGFTESLWGSKLELSTSYTHKYEYLSEIAKAALVLDLYSLVHETHKYMYKYSFKLYEYLVEHFAGQETACQRAVWVLKSHNKGGDSIIRVGVRIADPAGHWVMWREVSDAECGKGYTRVRVAPGEMLMYGGSGQLETLHHSVWAACQDQVVACCPPCGRHVGQVVLGMFQGVINPFTDLASVGLDPFQLVLAKLITISVGEVRFGSVWAILGQTGNQTI
ncbi:hypothetical protein EDB85DRAFT_1889602 [Lactarius pseudohatsudake]|nr:hypothetical protein EDB85DRAFT_1889602 [Lactarius pseudohatsudake]